MTKISFRYFYPRKENILSKLFTNRVAELLNKSALTISNMKIRSNCNLLTICHSFSSVTQTLLNFNRHEQHLQQNICNINGSLTKFI